MFISLSNIFRLIRPLSNVKNLVIVFLAFYFSSQTLDFFKIITGLLAMSLISSSVYGYNSFCDFTIDELNKNKKHYRESVAYFGRKVTLGIVASLGVAGLILSLFINIYFLVSLIFLLLVGFLYSSQYTRFKDKFILDIIFGGFLTFLIRFFAAWFIFKISFPPLLPIVALIFAKGGGYLLYKNVDWSYLIKSRVKNSITCFSNRTKVSLSIFFWLISFFAILLLFLNGLYFKADFLGALEVRFLILLPFFIPPLIIIHFLSFYGIKTRYLRILGYIYWLIIILLTLIFVI